MSKPRALIYGRMEVPAAIEAEFNAWYNAEHMGWRLERVPGILAGRRYRALKGSPKYAALYDLANVDVLKSEPYLAIGAEERTNPTPEYQKIRPQFQSFARTLYEEITRTPTDYRPPAEGRALLAAMLVPRAEDEDEFNDWYDTEHAPAIRSVAGVLSGRRFRAVEGEPKYLALYDLISSDVLESKEYAIKRHSPWADRIRSRLQSRIHFVYERIFP
ncbi:MAG: hypothetical protein HY329_12560 [Chloroflexi bacterium]|nr:hypothetical protein [Chloroflexota bacterium]